jgi:alpha-methylacyl-CoA racemase
MRLNGGYPVYGIYETKDGKYFSFGNLEPKFFDAFCSKAGRPDLKELHYSGFDKNRDRLEKELVKLMKTRTRDEWAELLADADTCAAPVLSLAEMMEDPQVKERKMIVKGPHPEGGEFLQAGFPIKFSEAEPEPPRPAPKLGEHTEEVLLSVGYTRKEIELFREKGVI